MHRTHIFIATTFLALGGCGTDRGVSGPPGDHPLPSEPARPWTTSELRVAGANNQFAFELLRTVLRDEATSNVLLSPLSASMALGMTMNGAEGETRDAMQGVLGFGGLREEEVNEAYRGLFVQLRARDSRVEFRLANGIWHRAGFEVKQPFLTIARNYFGARVDALDFDDPESPKIISRWAEEQTGGRIRDLVEQIDANDVMFLVNAVYFKAPWATPFEPQATRDREFRRGDGSAVQVPTMTRDGLFASLSRDGVQVVELPYADSAFSMILAAPTDGSTLAQMVNNLTAEQWAGWIGALETGRVMLSMPKFRFDYDITMNDALTALGMGVAFDSELADFDGIHDSTRDDLYISQVRQKAFIDVHELGTEAAAATSITISVTSMPPVMTFDRPFLFVIRERGSGTILFAGRVGDPSA